MNQGSLAPDVVEAATATVKTKGEYEKGGRFLSIWKAAAVMVVHRLPARRQEQSAGAAGYCASES